MKFERLKRSYKKEIVIGAIALCIVSSALTFVTTRAKYKLTQSIDLVKGTINYKPYDFKIMAMYKSDDGTNYTEITDRMPSGYVINEDKSYCTLDNKSHDTEVVLKTVNGNHVFNNLKKSDKCYLYFDKELTSKDTLAKLNIVNVKTTTPTFSNIVTTDEGVYSASDSMYGGTSYYYRGAVTNNYVKFAGFCWRIIRINGDGSIRLIYDGTTSHANGTSDANSIAKTNQRYTSSSDRSEYVGWTYSIENQRPTEEIASNIKTQTDSWYSSNITGTNVSKMTDGKFCNDRDVATGYYWSSQPSSTFNYAAYDRSGAKSASSVTPTMSCPTGDVYTLKVGLITMDEVVMAGGKFNTSNSSYYLYNGQPYWTMSPSGWTYNSSFGRNVCIFYVDLNGQLSWNIASNAAPGIRPVINLRSNVTFSTGDGTQFNPYIVS